MFWNGDVPAFALRSCLDSIVQTARLHLIVLTYEPGPFPPSFANVDVASAECFLPQSDFQKHRSFGVSQEMLAQFITVSGCVQKGGWSTDTNIIWLRRAPTFA